MQITLSEHKRDNVVLQVMHVLRTGEEYHNLLPVNKHL